MNTATLNITVSAAQIPHEIDASEALRKRIAALPPRNDADVARWDIAAVNRIAAPVETHEQRLARLVAALPEHARRQGGTHRLGWSEDVPLVWIAPEPSAEELAERAARGMDF